jgi:hypothetical protein
VGKVVPPPPPPNKPPPLGVCGALEPNGDPAVVVAPTAPPGEEWCITTGVMLKLRLFPPSVVGVPGDCAPPPRVHSENSDTGGGAAAGMWVAHLMLCVANKGDAAVAVAVAVAASAAAAATAAATATGLGTASTTTCGTGAGAEDDATPPVPTLKP